MSRATLSLLAATMLFFLSVAVAQQRTDSAAKNTLSSYAELAKAPEMARAKRNPFEHDSEAIAAGRILFEQHCAACHGDSANGGKKAPSLRAPEVQDSTPGAIFWLITNGVVRHGMPVWSKLPEPQRWQLVSYIKSLGVKSQSIANGAPAQP